MKKLTAMLLMVCMGMIMVGCTDSGAPKKSEPPKAPATPPAGGEKK
jgi:hypothetical protein